MKAREQLIKEIIDKGLITDENKKREFLLLLDMVESEAKAEQLYHQQLIRNEFEHVNNK